MTNQNPKEHIVQLILESKTEEAIEQVLNWAQSLEHKEAMQLMHMQKVLLIEAEEEKINGSNSAEEYETELRNINQALLEAIRELEIANADFAYGEGREKFVTKKIESQRKVIEISFLFDEEDQVPRKLFFNVLKSISKELNIIFTPITHSSWIDKDFKEIEDEFAQYNYIFLLLAPNLLKNGFFETNWIEHLIKINDEEGILFRPVLMEKISLEKVPFNLSFIQPDENTPLISEKTNEPDDEAINKFIAEFKRSIQFVFQSEEKDLKNPTRKGNNSNQFRRPLELAFQTRPVQNIVLQKDIADANAFAQYEKFMAFEHKSSKGNEFFQDLLRDLKDYNDDYRELTRTLHNKTSKYQFLKIVDYLAGAIESNFHDEAPANWEEKRKLFRKELVEYRANGNQLLPDLLSENVIHALRYLQEPKENLPVISDDFRRLISKNVLGESEYDDILFTEKVFFFFKDFEFEVENPQNRSALYAALLFDPKVKELWDRSTPEKEGGVNLVLEPENQISNYPKHDADIPKGADKLNIMPDVRAFARLMASKDLRPPLSIGVFGNWGSGKSFFMEKMEEVVKRLTDSAKVGVEGTNHYVKDIVQIKFNAWYYIDANLWASLVTHIFEQLSKAVGNKTEEEKREIFARRRLAEALQHQNAILKEIQEAEKEKERIQAEIDLPQTNRRRTSELEKAQKVQQKIIDQANREINRIRENQKMLEGRITIYEKRRGAKGSEDARALMALFQELKGIEEEIIAQNGKVDEEKIKRRKAILSNIRALEIKDENIRGQLYEDLATTYHLIEEAEIAKREALKNVEEVQKEISAIETERLKRQDEIHKTALNFVVDQIRGDDEFQGFVKEVVKKFNVAVGKDEKGNKKGDEDILKEIKKMGTEEIQGILNEYDSTRHRWLSVFNFLQNLSPLSWMLLIIFILIPFAMAEFVQSWQYLDDVLDDWIARIAATFTSIVLAIQQISKPAKKAMEAIDEGISYVEKAKSKIEEFEKRKNARIEVLKQQYEKLSEQQKEAQQRLQKAKEEVAKIRQEILEISKGKRLASFIERRLGSNDYQQHLGLISLIRQDFDKLSKYLKQKIDEVKEDRKIDRIILYIDDLDRCPPEKVIEVLQAIHLILAFDLFVVVVGVDVRWVSRSLMKRYPEMLRAFQANGENAQKTPEFAKSLKGNATPYDYLEKIFQIPFKIKDLEDDDKESYIEKLLGDEVVDDIVIEATEIQSPLSGEAEETDNVPNLLLGTSGHEEKELEQSQESKTIEDLAKEGLEKTNVQLKENERIEQTNEIVEEEDTLSEGIDEEIQKLEEEINLLNEEEVNEEEQIEEEIVTEVLNMEPVKISQSEFEFLKILTPILGDSPRAIKRFINVYRLIKSNDNWKLENRQPYYREVLVLLSIVTTAPTLSQDFFEVLINEPNRQMDFDDFVKKLKQYAAFGKITAAPEQHERLIEELSSLINFFTNLPKDEAKSKLIREVGQLEIERFQNLVPLVSRFSFRAIE